IDITADYANWVRVGFALASICGVAGEQLFHRISQFHPKYDHNETHKLYNSCLKNNSGVVTIGTIVYLMKN
ncbi:MAG: PriCT-2 domain-containing protein, partial [Paludibacteraceae bacterium]|nr:PriCT-2 domain-containing protein [Paludibacteraceae bacterium]